MMLHVPNIIFDDEAEGHRLAIADRAHGGQHARRDVLHEPRKQCVVLIPEIDKKIPWNVLIAVDSYPFHLSIARPPIPGFEGATDEADMVVGGRIDQMPEFLFGRPRGRPFRLYRCSIGIERAKVGQIALYCSPEKRSEIVGRRLESGHLVPLAVTLFGKTHAVITPPLLVRTY